MFTKSPSTCDSCNDECSLYFQNDFGSPGLIIFFFFFLLQLQFVFLSSSLQNKLQFCCTNNVIYIKKNLKLKMKQKGYYWLEA